jgi:glycosyltransferase involved in cell wall biosynthesis
VTPPSLRLSEADVVVAPEIYGPHIPEIAPGVPKVILNQGVYLTFRHYPRDVRELERRVPPFRHPDVVASIVKTDDAYEYLRFAFPRARVLRVRNSVDPTLFHPEEPKEPWIGYMPRRNVEDGHQVLSILAFRGALRGYEVVEIEGVGETDAAALLRRCLVFLSLGYQEGFGRPAAEAMACGAAVVGYHGNGGREFLRPEFAHPVPTADIRAFAHELEKVLTSHVEHPDRLRDRRHRAAEFIRATYSPELEEAELLSAWEEILSTVRRRSKKRFLDLPRRGRRPRVR